MARVLNSLRVKTWTLGLCEEEEEEEEEKVPTTWYTCILYKSNRTLKEAISLYKEINISMIYVSLHFFI